MSNANNVKVWNATQRNLLIGEQAIVLRPAESAWVDLSSVRTHVESGALAVIESAEVAEIAPAEAPAKRSRKKAEQEITEEATEETAAPAAEENAQDQETIEAELNASSSNENSEEDVPENSQ